MPDLDQRPSCAKLTGFGVSLLSRRGRTLRFGPIWPTTKTAAEQTTGTMADYRAYILDGAGDILLSEELVASSDAAAITAGLQSAALYGVALPAQGVELWGAGRLVFSTHPRG